MKLQIELTTILFMVVMGAFLTFALAMLVYSWKLNKVERDARKLRLVALFLFVALEFATTIYDLKGEPGHFPLYVRIPILTTAAVASIKASMIDHGDN